MVPLLLAAVGVLTLAVLTLGFLLLGLMRKVDILDWRYEQLSATTPRRIGRDGLKLGGKAPDFTLPSLNGPEMSLHDFAGRKLLLVFTQDGCGPCHDLLPVLSRIQQEKFPVLAVHSGSRDKPDPELQKHASNFPVLYQNNGELSKRYQIMGTPFAYMLNESGRVAAKGIVNTAQHVQLLLDEAEQWESKSKAAADSVESPGADSPAEQTVHESAPVAEPV